jgi:hypothetical protein
MRDMSRTSSAHKPWTRWGLSLALILTGVYNLLLALDNVRHAADYRALGVSYPPLLRAALALGWGAALVVLGAALAWGAAWTFRRGWILVSNYGVFSVLWMIVFAESDFSRGRIGFQAITTAALAGLVVWMLRWRRIRGVGRSVEPVSNAGELVYDQQHAQN